MTMPMVGLAMTPFMAVQAKTLSTAVMAMISLIYETVAAMPMVGLATISCLVVLVQTTCWVVGDWISFTAVPATTISPMVTDPMTIRSITQIMDTGINTSSPTAAGTRPVMPQP